MAIVAIGILSLLIIGTLPLSSQLAAQESEQKFSAKLSGKEEVPLNESPSTGLAWVKITGDQLGYEVNVTDMDKVNAAHTHLCYCVRVHQLSSNFTVREVCRMHIYIGRTVLHCGN